MGRIAYVNGRFVPHAQATVHIEDRGYQLADAIYEVWALFDGKLADAEGHFARLERSLSELQIPMPMSRKALTLLLREAREVFEREYLNAQMLRFSGNISRTAAFIGMERSALHRKLKSLGLTSGRALEEEVG